MIIILSVISFLICWLLVIVFTIDSAVIRRKLERESKTYDSSIIRNKRYFDSIQHLKTQTKMIVGFGSKKSIDTYLDTFIDLKKIEELEISNLKTLLVKLRRNVSGYSIAFCVGIISIVNCLLASQV